jgi:hypothetical protein
MILPDQVRNAFAAHHLVKHEDAYVQNYLVLLRTENDRLRDELRALKPVGFTPSGRYVLGQAAAAILIGIMLAIAGFRIWQFVNEPRVTTALESPVHER